MISHPFLVKALHSRHFLEDRCVNCLEPLAEDIVGPWCSTWCNETNEVVRYWRRIERDERRDDPLVREVVRTRVAFLLNGGYKALGRRPTAATRALVIQRDQGRCRECGRVGTEIDHVDGNSDDPSNLQLLCSKCHRAKTAGAMTEADDISKALIFALKFSRVDPSEPQLLADDEVAWSGLWRQLQVERKQRFEARLRADGFDLGRANRSMSQVLAAYKNWTNT